MHQPLPQWLLEPQWFLPLFVLLWVGICGLLSLFSGWSGLNSYFRAQQPVLGERFRFVSASMGNRFFPVHYRNCLFITVNDSGFRLSIFFPFRFLTPPLFIPWEAVESIEPRRFLFFLRYSVIRLRDRWPAISVHGGAGQRIAEVYSSRSRPSEHNLVY